MNRITFFDVEYANSKNKSLCQLALMCEDFETGELVCIPKTFYIDPEDGFDDNCIKVHGISAQKVKGAPSFQEIWKEIEQYFTNAVVVGHNVASADLDALVKNLPRYGVAVPEMYYL